MIHPATLAEVLTYAAPVAGMAMARRQGERHNRRGIGGVKKASSPLAIITSSPPKLWTDARLGAGANGWADQTANGNNFAEPTNPPILGTLGGNPCYVGDGVAQRFRNASLTVTAGQWYWMIARPITWAANASLCGGKTSANATVFGTGSSPEVSLFSGVTGAPNSAGVPGSWYRYKWLCTGNAGNDYLQIGSVKQPGTGGANAEVGWDIFCRAGTAFGNWAIAAIVICPGEPTVPEQTKLDTDYAAASFAGVGF